jgi:hypothetical protein
LSSRGALKDLKDSKLILNESKLFPWSSRISLVPFKTFRWPLFSKPVTGQELFLAVFYSKPALVPICHTLTTMLINCGLVKKLLDHAFWAKLFPKLFQMNAFLKCHPCPFILILPWFYPDFVDTHFIQILSRFYPMFWKYQDKIWIKVCFFLLYPHFILILSRFIESHFILILSW